MPDTKSCQARPVATSIARCLQKFPLREPGASSAALCLRPKLLRKAILPTRTWLAENLFSHSSSLVLAPFNHVLHVDCHVFVLIAICYGHSDYTILRICVKPDSFRLYTKPTNSLNLQLAKSAKPFPGLRPPWGLVADCTFAPSAHKHSLMKF